MTYAEELWQDLTRATKVRNAIAEAQDPVMRLFTPSDVEDIKSLQWSVLDEVIRTIEQKYPDLYLWWSLENECYGLHPRRKERNT